MNNVKMDYQTALYTITPVRNTNSSGYVYTPWDVSGGVTDFSGTWLFDFPQDWRTQLGMCVLHAPIIPANQNILIHR